MHGTDGRLYHPCGGMREWLKRAVLKSTRCQAGHAESSSYPVKIAVLRVLRVPWSALDMQHRMQQIPTILLGLS
jgi:hypothetical protein